MLPPNSISFVIEEGRMTGGKCRPWMFLLFILFLMLAEGTSGITNATDLRALQAVHAQLGDPNGRLHSWRGHDPCGDGPWAGVFCKGPVGRVTELRLFQMGLQGELASEVGDLQNLVTLNVMRNNISGSLPPSIGNLTNLMLLLVSGNQMTGALPPELGQLKNLNRLQVDENNFTGPIPTTFANLTSMKHLHLNNNSLSGSIPASLGSLPNVVHILVDNNQLTGAIPPDLANSSSLHILQLDNNPLHPQPIPSSFGEPGRFPNLIKLSMRGCNLQGKLPPGMLRNMPSLKFLDLSQNSLVGGIPMLSLSNLTSVYLSSNNLSQDVGGLSLGPLPHLHALLLPSNNLSGKVDVASLLGLVKASPQRITVDMQKNSISNFFQAEPLNVSLLLNGNPICESSLDRACNLQESSLPPQLLDPDNNKTRHLPGPDVCCRVICTFPQAAWPVGSPPYACTCRFPITLRLRLKSPSVSILGPFISTYQNYTAEVLSKNGTVLLSAGQVYVRNYTWQPGPRVLLDLQLFPDPEDMFQQHHADDVFTLFSNWQFPEQQLFGPYEFIEWIPGLYVATAETSGSKGGGIGAGVVAGAVAASVAATALVGWLVTKRRKGTTVRRGLTGGDRSSVHITGVKEFTFQELSDATDGFSEERSIGRGGYGRVYHGELAEEGQVAIKRAQVDSLQGSKEFYTEIELLSRVHHRNLVKLVGYCHDQGEQMLVYEYMEGGTLRDNLSGEAGLDLPARLRIALGSARGIAYLHNEANPPIFHRDIKATNILLDKKRNAKVADFGLSKLAPAPDQEGSGPGHVSTVVKGTPGYLDPEYFLTHQLTDKSDVYSFGVVLLELITGLHPISHGKNIVREVKMAFDSGTGTVLDIVDPHMGEYSSEIVQPLVRLAVSCCEDDPDKRPSILEVVRDLDDIWRTMPWGVSTDTEASISAGLPSTRPSVERSYSDISNADCIISRTVIDFAPR